jgi:hypothetical protein
MVGMALFAKPEMVVAAEPEMGSWMARMRLTAFQTIGVATSISRPRDSHQDRRAPRRMMPKLRRDQVEARQTIDDMGAGESLN